MLFSCCDKLPFCMITNPDAPIRIKTLVLWNDVLQIGGIRVCECSYADELALQLHCISCVLCEKNLFAILAFLYMHGHRITSIVTSMWDMKPINVCKVHGPYIKIILGRLIAGMCENVKSFNADVGFSWLCEYVRPTRITQSSLSGKVEHTNIAIGNRPLRMPILPCNNAIIRILVINAEHLTRLDIKILRLSVYGLFCTASQIVTYTMYQADMRARMQ